MEFITQSFDNREKAILVWLGILFLLALSQQDFRRPIFSILSKLTEKVILVTTISMLVYIGGMIYVFYYFKFWDWSLLGETIIWSFGTAFVLYLNITKFKGFYEFKKTVRENIKITVFVEFIVNLYVFNFWVELIFIPVIVILGVILGFMSTDKKFKLVESYLVRLASIIGIGILGFVLINIIIDFEGFASIGNIKEFLLPILFTAFFLPYIYILALYLVYDLINRHIKKLISDKSLARYTFLKTILRFNFNLEKLNLWDRKFSIGNFGNKEEINAAMKAV